MIPKTGNRPEFNSSLGALSLSALGVVFGDIGTSPLYTLKTVLALTGGKPDRAVILGTLTLVIWTLIIVTTIKYVSFAMRIDNDGEGGIHSPSCRCSVSNLSTALSSSPSAFLGPR